MASSVSRDSQSLAHLTFGVTTSGIYLTKSEHDLLIELSRRYTNLRTNLINLGADPSTIEQYSNQDPIEQSHDACQDRVFSESTQASQPLETHDRSSAASSSRDISSSSSTAPSPTVLARCVRVPHHKEAAGDQRTRSYVSGFNNDHHREYDETPDMPDTDIEFEPDEDDPDYVPRKATRSLRFDGLAAGTTVADITNVVRGGRILEIYLRSRERAATVSFVHERDADVFWQRFRQNNLIIRNRIIDISIADNHKILSSHVCNRIMKGASRNFVVRNCDPYQDAQGLQDDIEHIHDLIVASIECRDRDWYIKTNSINGAMFARSCMSSRRRYKNCQIEWLEDECASPWPEEPTMKAKKPKVAKAQAHVPVNRFQMLSFE